MPDGLARAHALRTQDHELARADLGLVLRGLLADLPRDAREVLEVGGRLFDEEVLLVVFVFGVVVDTLPGYAELKGLARIDCYEGVVDLVPLLGDVHEVEGVAGGLARLREKGLDSGFHLVLLMPC